MRFHRIVGVLSIAVAAMIVHPEASAQFTGPGSRSSTASVAEILKNPLDNQRVVLRGKILRRLGGDKYLFSDGSAEIIVDIDDNEWPSQPVNENTVIELTGKVDVEFLRPTEIDVKRLKIAN